MALNFGYLQVLSVLLITFNIFSYLILRGLLSILYLPNLGFWQISIFSFPHSGRESVTFIRHISNTCVAGVA